MKIAGMRLWMGGAVIGLACFLPTAQTWAQQRVASQPGGQSIASTETASDATSATVPAVTLHDNDFVIGNGDMLNISVWKQPDLSRSLPVRSDGKISLPLIGEIQASGETPLKLEDAITAKYRPYLNEPEITVIVEQINSQKFNILGRVAKPGSYPLINRTTVLDAIALAGGCVPFAKQKSIYILRRHPDGSDSKLPFNYREVIKGKNTAQNIELQPHDTVVVP